MCNDWYTCNESHLRYNESRLCAATHSNTLQHAATQELTHWVNYISMTHCVGDGNDSVCWWWKWISVLVQRMSYCVCDDDDSWSTLQHTATHCNTLQHIATYCNTLQHTATHDYVSSRWKWLNAFVIDWVISMTHCARRVGELLSSWRKWLSAFVTHTCASNHTT